jgi:hypothetical protein
MPSRTLPSRKLLCFGGLLVGLVALLIGFAITISINGSGDSSFDILSEIPVLAEGMAHSEEGSILATATLDDNLDGLYFFDGLTGELTVVALNSREHRFMAVFRKNIVSDFFGKDKNGKVKNPKFMMTVGTASLLQRPNSRFRWGDSVIYMLERNTGRVVCYGVPLPPNMKAQKDVQRGRLEIISKIEIREAAVRGG